MLGQNPKVTDLSSSQVHVNSAEDVDLDSMLQHVMVRNCPMENDYRAEALIEEGSLLFHSC